MGLGLGFDMNNIFVALFAMLILAINISCLKKQNLEDQNLGPVVTPAEVQQKMGEAIGELNFGDMKIGEFSSVVSSITLEDSQNIKLFQQDLTITAFPVTETEATITFDQTVENFLRPSESFQNKNKTFNPLKQIQSDPANMKTDDPLLLPLEYYSVGHYYCGQDNVTCHNLSVSPIHINLNPQLIIDPKICPSAQTCQVSARKIEFDLLDGRQLNDQGKPSRFHYSFIVAGQMPFLSKVLQSCVRGLMQYGNRKVVAENCTFVISINSGN